MNTPAAIRAVIARPDGPDWKGRYVHGFGAPTDLGPVLYRFARNAHGADRQGGITTLTWLLLDAHQGWNRIGPVCGRLGDCRCHHPTPAALSWPDTQMLTPGQCARADYAYILAPGALHIQARIDGDWTELDRADYTREPDPAWFQALTIRVRDLLDAAAWANDPRT